MRYGKINYFGELEYAPTQLNIDGKIVINPTEEDLLSQGYKLVIEESFPENKENWNIAKSFEENENDIIVHYLYEPILETEIHEPENIE